MKDYYIFKSGRISRKDNSIFLETAEGNIPIPVNEVDSLYLFGEIDLNTRAINFFARQGIVLHTFNYYGWYCGSFFPREQLLSGEVVVRQAEHYLDPQKRMYIASELVSSAIHGFIYNLKHHLKSSDPVFAELKGFMDSARRQPSISALMGIEGNARELYYGKFPEILGSEYNSFRRKKNPPDNMLNALISFSNSLIYTAVIKEIYRTQLNPTVSYLHEPFYRRFSLALDVAEIFKPIYADRIIFNLLNNRRLNQDHFDQNLNCCYLKESGRKIVVREFDEKMQTTVVYRRLKRKVSYQTIIRLELYRLIRHLLQEERYKAFRIWW